MFFTVIPTLSHTEITMKASIVLLIAVSIASFVCISSAQSPLGKHEATNLEGKYACAIFPLCTDPDNYKPLIIKGDKSKDKSGSDKKDLKIVYDFLEIVFH